jgi:hypothetical protein
MKLPGIFKRKSKETVNNRGNTDLGRTTQFRGVIRSDEKKSKHLGLEQRKQRTQRLRQARLTGVKEFFREKRVIFVAIAAVIIVLSTVFLLVRVLSASGTFLLAEIEVSGNEEVSTAQVEQALNSLIGTSLFSFDARDVENLLKEQFSFIKEVYVRKVPPKLLEVEIEERYPVLQLVDLSGAYLVDEEGIFINARYPESTIELTETEQGILNGYGMYDAEYVYAYYLEQRINEEGFVEVDWSQIPIEEKIATLEKMRLELVSRVENRLNENLTSLIFREFPVLPVIQSTSNSTYQIGSNYSQDRLSLLLSIKSFLASNSIEVAKYYWSSDFTLEVNVAPSGTLIFSVTRNTKLQTDALLAVWSEIGKTSGKIIDLRSELVSVK